MLLKCANYLNYCRRKLCQEVNHGLKIYNCKTKQKTPLNLENPLYSSWYTCGPTVYDSAHVGHASTYVRLDILQRILISYFGVNLVTAMNITNIDDKIIKKSNETGKNWKLIAEEYEAEFWEDMDSLNVRHPDIKIRVTDEIPAIINFIESIEEQGFTEVTDDGLHFKTSAYENYGKLQKVAIDDSKAANFALWKAAKPGEPSWDSKWGPGRPGWHIECSTLASLVFGSQIDFHAGGIDLKFPHHENEEAQSCVYHCVDDWVANWIHTGHLHLPGQSEKMSKSLKNTVTIRDFLKEFSRDQFRVACLLSHYRSPIEFGPELLTAADAVLKKIQSFNNDVRAFVAGLKGSGAVDQEQLQNTFLNCRELFFEALSDDFNTGKAMGSLLELMSVTSKMINSDQGYDTFDGSDRGLVLGIAKYIEDDLKMFGIEEKNQATQSNNGQWDNLVTSIVRVRNEIRLKAKENKNEELFKVCDDIRDTLKDNRIEIKDHQNMSSWNKI